MGSLQPIFSEPNQAMKSSDYSTWQHVLILGKNKAAGKNKNMVLMRLELMTLELLAPRSNLLS